MLDNTYYQYDKMLFSQLKEVPRQTFVSQNNLAVPSYREDAPPKVNIVDERTAIKLMKYFITYYLNWDAEYAMEHLNYDVLKRGNLLKSAIPRINIPSEVKNNPEFICYYLICKIFPETYSYDKDLAIENYHDIMLNHKPVMAIHYFEDSPEGIERSLVALNHAVMNLPAGMTIRQIYEFISSKEGKEWLRKHRLIRACEKYFNDPAEFLHEALPPEVDDLEAYAEYKKKSPEKQNKETIK